MIELIILSVVLTNGASGLLSEGWPLAFIGRFLDAGFVSSTIRSKWRDEDGVHYLAYPLYKCPPCMSSLWSVALYALCAASGAELLPGVDWSLHSLYELPIMAVGTFGINEWLNNQRID